MFDMLHMSMINAARRRVIPHSYNNADKLGHRTAPDTIVLIPHARVDSIQHDLDPGVDVSHAGMVQSVKCVPDHSVFFKI